jgi:hypothetical protein
MMHVQTAMFAALSLLIGAVVVGTVLVIVVG